MTGWATKEQKNAMIEFMKTHKQLSRGKITATFTKGRRTAQWTELTYLLNSCGPVRSVKSWKGVWQRFCNPVPSYKKITPGVERNPVKTKCSTMNSAAPRTSSRQNSSIMKRSDEPFVQDQSVSEGNAKLYLNRRKAQKIKTVCFTPQIASEAQKNGEVNSPQGGKRVCSITEIASEAQKSGEVNSPQEEKRVCSITEITSEAEESEELSSQQQKKRDKVTTLNCLSTLTESMVKAHQAMTEATWALVRVQEKRAKAEESMAQSGKNLIVLLENWLQKQ